MNLLPSLHVPGCTKCKLSQLRTHIVPSYLPDTTEILFIAEAPGKKEDEEGTQPLIGPAGDKLNEFFRYTGLSRQDPRLGFSNCVRCRPKEPPESKRENRLPKDAEIRACSSYLDAEISSLPNLKLIVALGAIATKRLLGSTGMKLEDLRGRVMNTKDYGPVLPTYHPAMFFHTGGGREEAQKRSLYLNDFHKVKDILDGTVEAQSTGTQKEVNHYVVRTLEQARWLFQQLHQAELFAYDIETSALDYLNSKILSVSFSWEMRTAVTLPLFLTDLKPAWSEEEWDVIITGLKEAMEDSVPKKVAQNGKYDNQHLYAAGIEVKNFYADTMLMHFLLDENSPHDLKSLAWTYTDRGGYELQLGYLRRKIAKERKLPYKELSFACLPSEDLWKYANMDADVTFRLYHIFLPKLVEEGTLDLLFELYMPMSNLLAKIEYSGVSINRDYLDQTITNFQERIGEKEEEILKNKEVQRYIQSKRDRQRQKLTLKWEKSKTLQNRATLEEYITSHEEEMTINFASPKQLRELFIDQLGLKVFKKTDKGNPSLDDEALEYYSKKVPVARLFSQRNKLVHLMSTFLEGMRNSIRSDGKLHTSFNLHVAKTARLSSTNPNLQNVPNIANNPDEAKIIRNIFIADPGCVLIEADFAQAEFRMFGQLAEDPVLYEDLRQGVDIHTRIGSLGFKVSEAEITKKQRADAKTVVFGTMYGRTPESVAEQLDISLEAAKEIQAAMFKRYSLAAGWIRKNIMYARREKKVRGLFGQLRHLEGQINNSNIGIKREAERQATNSPIQGGSSQMCCFAALKMSEEFEKQGIRNARVLMLIHDAIMINVHQDDRKQAAQIMKSCMLNPHPLVTVPLAIEMKVGIKWGDLAPYEV